MLTHSFYGAKALSYVRLCPDGKAIKTLGELFSVLLSCWSKETANPNQNDLWNRANVTAGQSEVSALLVCDMFGGAIHKIKIDETEHYFNKVNGSYIDLTREQYELADIRFSYEPNEELARDRLLSDEDTATRYKLLLKRISEYLS